MDLSANLSLRSTQATYKAGAALCCMENKRDKRRELEEYAAEETFHRREWLVQRVGWAALAVILIAACAGLLGNGPLAYRTLISENGELTIDRFARRDGPTTWAIKPNAVAVRGSTFRVRVTSSMLQRVKIEAITPAPEAQVMTSNGVLFTFQAIAANTQVLFQVEPQSAGWMRGDFQLGDSIPVTVEQFVYP
jgi:hypothetical protein